MAHFLVIKIAAILIHLRHNFFIWHNHFKKNGAKYFYIFLVLKPYTKTP
ncbi:hypothetical protein TERTU_0522 [Teredinibacter turnerae T7901]|uniref:Uncharacterized protein n=1 Tax=Teredinibacter turnerae (strain ATCC 39867 / T7901) TaxID=377629 RepID=C5BN26_TERTT|nr:hypothetical protein TERTU_0522 [Teredinibacter turnerae T7901]